MFIYNFIRDSKNRNFNLRKVFNNDYFLLLPECSSGGIGRRAGFKIQFFLECGFDSHLEYKFIQISKIHQGHHRSYNYFNPNKEIEITPKPIINLNILCKTR